MRLKNDISVGIVDDVLFAIRYWPAGISTRLLTIYTSFLLCFDLALIEGPPNQALLCCTEV